PFLPPVQAGQQDSHSSSPKVSRLASAPHVPEQYPLSAATVLRPRYTLSALVLLSRRSLALRKACAALTRLLAASEAVDAVAALPLAFFPLLHVRDVPP